MATVGKHEYDKALDEDIDRKLEGFDTRRDILVVPSSALPRISSGVKTIGLPDIRNVAKVRVGR